MEETSPKIEFTWTVEVSTYLASKFLPTPEYLNRSAFTLRRLLHFNPSLWDKTRLVSCEIGSKRVRSYESVSQIRYTWEGPLQSIHFDQTEAERLLEKYLKDFDDDHIYSWVVRVPEHLFGANFPTEENLRRFAFALHDHVYPKAHREEMPVLYETELFYEHVQGQMFKPNRGFLLMTWEGLSKHKVCHARKARLFVRQYKVTSEKIRGNKSGFLLEYFYPENEKYAMKEQMFSFHPVSYIGGTFKQMHLMVRRRHGTTITMYRVFLNMENTELFDRCKEIECMIFSVTPVEEVSESRKDQSQAPGQPIVDKPHPVTLIFRTQLFDERKRGADCLDELRHGIYGADESISESHKRILSMRMVPKDYRVVPLSQLKQRLSTLNPPPKVEPAAYDFLTSDPILEPRPVTQSEDEEDIKEDPEFVTFSGYFWRVF